MTVSPLRASARRAFLAGNRQAAFDLARCDPTINKHQPFGAFCAAMAHELVDDDARVFAESLIKRRLDMLVKYAGQSGRPHDEAMRREQCRAALSMLERMDERDVINLRYRLAKAAPHQIDGMTAVDLVRQLMGAR